MPAPKHNPARPLSAQPAAPSAAEVRRQFIAFFEARGHRAVRSAPVTPQNDPTLLFTNAGMNQFKDVFLGKGQREYTRAVDAQKCIRASGKHNDLEDVGRDHYHHTFFEMLGNWSFGDYFKREAIGWAWELLVEHWGLDGERMWATVFGGTEEEGLAADLEAEALWLELTPLPRERVLRCGRKDNFWEMGASGPCGPCSELHYDLGAEVDCPACSARGQPCAVNAEGCWRFIELWNLVFIQFNRQADGRLETLPAQHVDTGLGLERITRVLQGKHSNYDTDLFTPLLEEVRRLSGRACEEGEEAVAARVLADHARTLCFAIADGALPSNEGRGYVLRRMLRRAARFAHLLGVRQPLLHRLVPVVASVMGQAYPEVREQQEHIQGVLLAEEESFQQTLARGLALFGRLLDEARSAGRKALGGEEVFRLYDTFGFPVDLTRLIAQEQGLDVDMAGFEARMEAQRRRGRAGIPREEGGEAWQIFAAGGLSTFEGYAQLTLQARVLRMRPLGGDAYAVVLERTPFYPQGGGQVADRGWLQAPGLRLEVHDVQRDGDWIIQRCQAPQGTSPAQVEQALRSPQLTAQVDADWRADTTRNHTATHLLHAALRQVLGAHVRQAGSVVHPHYLRFDFTHPRRLTPQELERCEQQINEQVRRNIMLGVRHTSYEEALAQGVVALFGEKYEDTVRVVEVEGFSAELCGGCHVQATGEIGLVAITGESAVAAGVRRITALSGARAEAQARSNARTLEQLKQRLNTSAGALLERLNGLLDEHSQLEQALRTARRSQQGQNIQELVQQAQTVEDTPVLATQVRVDSPEELRRLGDQLRSALPGGVVVLGAQLENKASLLCTVSESLVQRGLKAGAMIDEIARVAGGRGGGAASMAMAGAKQPEKLSLALHQAPQRIQEHLQRVFRSP